MLEKGPKSYDFGPFYLVREGGLEPPRPERALEPESSESTNSTTRAFESLLTIAFSIPLVNTFLWEDRKTIVTLQLM